MKSTSNSLISSIFFCRKDFIEICDKQHDHNTEKCKTAILLKILSYKERTGKNQESLFIKITSVAPLDYEEQTINLSNFTELNNVFHKKSFIRVDRKSKDIHNLLDSEVSPFLPKGTWLSTDLFKSNFISILECLKNYNNHLTKIDISDIERKINKLKK